LQFGEFLRFLFQIGGGRLFGFFGFLRRNPGAVLFQLLFDLIGHLLVELDLGIRELLLFCSRRACARWAMSLSFCASCCSNCLRVDSISGAASDSVSLISVLPLGQMTVGSVTRLFP